MDRVIFICYDCEHKFEVEFKEIADLPGTVCPKCKGDHIFIREFRYDKKQDTTPLRMGDRGCGTPGRFK